MKKILIIILLVIVGFMIYNALFDNPESRSRRKGEELTIDAIKGRQLEAMNMLRKTYQKQESFHAQWGHYTYKFDSLDIIPKGTYYEMRIMDAKRNYFEIRAEGDIDDDGIDDVWTITEDGKLNHIVDDAKQ